MDYQESFGAIFSKKDVRDYKAVCTVAAEEFPKEFELKMPPVKNQGAVGSCVAHSIALVVEYFSRLQGDNENEMSVGYIYGNRGNSLYTGKGMYVREAISATRSYGDVEKSLFPYNEEVPTIITKFEAQVNDLLPQSFPNRFTSYYSLNNDNEIKASLMQDGPVIFAMEWYSDIQVVKGIIKTNQNYSPMNGAHCMVIYGWNKDGWKIQNSWGCGWGVNGCAVLPYNIKRQEAWGIVDTYSEVQRNRRIEELEATNADLINQLVVLKDKTNNLLDETSSLLGKIDELNANNDKNIKEMRDKFDALEEERKQSEREFEKATIIIDAQKKEIELLEQELITIKKPYNSNLGKIFAKIFNFIYNIIYTTK